MIEPGPLVAAHTSATLAMAGLIWFVQLVHYPLFALAARRSFAEFARQHQRRTGWVVMPLMTVEAVTAVLLLTRSPGPWTAAGGALLALAWLSTAILQVPCHRRLTRGFDEPTIRRLVATNWLRTVAWTGRAAIALAIAGVLGGN